jgi:hypothetical protein
LTKAWQSTFVLFTLLAVLNPSVSAQIELRQVDGAIQTGRLNAIKSDGTVVFEVGKAAKPLEVPMAELVSLRFGNPPVSRHGDDSSLLRFEMASGDVIFGTVIDGDFDTVRVESVFGRIKLPLDSLERVVCLANAKGLDTRAKVIGDEGQDVLLVRSKSGVDSVHGSVAKFVRNGVMFEWGDGEESLFAFKKNRVASVSLAESEPAEAIKGVHAVVFFRDGSRLTGRLSKSAGSAMKFAHIAGSTLELSVVSVAEISVRNGRFVHLSDLKATSVAETPYLQGGLKYGLNVDQGIRGGPLSIGVRGFPRGLSVHSRCSVTYDISRGFESFSTAIGVDGAVANKRVVASIKFTVLVDDKVVAGPTLCRAGAEPVWLNSIALTGAKKLTLVADFADNYHFNGWAVWGSPYMVTKAESR